MSMDALPQLESEVKSSHLDERERFGTDPCCFSDGVEDAGTNEGGAARYQHRTKP
jgi:hypothetical protein